MATANKRIHCSAAYCSRQAKIVYLNGVTMASHISPSMPKSIINKIVNTLSCSFHFCVPSWETKSNFFLLFAFLRLHARARTKTTIVRLNGPWQWIRGTSLRWCHHCRGLVSVLFVFRRAVPGSGFITIIRVAAPTKGNVMNGWLGQAAKPC